MSGYDARAVSGEGADLAVDPNVSQGAAPRETSMTRRRQPIEMTQQGQVWAMSDPLGGIGSDGGMVGGSGGTIPLAQALSGIAGVGSSAPRPALRPSPAPGGLSGGLTSDNPALNLAMSIGQRALSIPTGLSLLGRSRCCSDPVARFAVSYPGRGYSS